MKEWKSEKVQEFGEEEPKTHPRKPRVGHPRKEPKTQVQKPAFAKATADKPKLGTRGTQAKAYATRS